MVFIAPQIPVRSNHIFGWFTYKSRTASEGPFATSQFPLPQGIWGEGLGEASPKAVSGLGYWGGRDLLRKRDREGDTEREEERVPQGKGRANEKKDKDRK